MDKLEFVARQLDKTKKKRFEQLVVHRIWNRLDDLRVKFVTQQYVRRPEGRALTDMYFPRSSDEQLRLAALILNGLTLPGTSD
jgi:hypothetical protein